MDRETIKKMLDLLNPLHGSVDRQIMNQITDECELDAPLDREYNVDITVRMERDLTQAVSILESQRDFDPLDAAQKAVMKYPYFTRLEALEIAKAVVVATMLGAK